MTTTLPTGTYPREEIDLTALRPVAVFPILNGQPITIYFNDAGLLRRFYVDTPDTPVIVAFRTIRQAVALALRNGGWG